MAAEDWTSIRVSKEAYEVLRLLAEEQKLSIPKVVDVLILSFTEKIEGQVNKLISNMRPAKPVVSAGEEFVPLPTSSGLGKALPANEVRRQRLEYERPGDVE